MKENILSLIAHLRSKELISFASMIGNKSFDLHSLHDEISILKEIHSFFDAKELDILDYSLRLWIDEDDDGEISYHFRFKIYSIK